MLLFTFVRDYFLVFMCLENAWEYALRRPHVTFVEARKEKKKTTGYLSLLLFALVP